MLLTALAAQGAPPALRVINTAESGPQLLRNPGFEEVEDTKASSWWAWHQGYQVARGEGRNGSRAARCERQENDDEAGASQTLDLDRTNLAPFVIRGWSKAENVSGSPDNGYSLYVDIAYQDGTSLWGRTAPFRCGSHDWERRQFVVAPEKPVKSLTLHCLFRGHTGKVWFDDAAVEEIATPAGTVLLHNLAVEPGTARKPGRSQSGQTFKTRDGLRLDLRGGAVVALKTGGKDLAGDAPSGFLARDFAAGSDFHSFDREICRELDLRLVAQWEAGDGHIRVAGRVTDGRGSDRAITLLFALPIDATGWEWGDDTRHSRRIEGVAEFAHTVAVRSGSGRMSRYPLGAVWNAEHGLALGLDMARPAQYTIAYHPGTRQLFIAYDLALVKDTDKFPSSADFSFVIYRFDPRWGFRAALQKYYDIFPGDFIRRVPREGVWMPFADIARVPGFEDFGFAFQEGASNVPFDDAHGIASFFYVEPMSCWLALPAGVPRTYEAAEETLRKDLAGVRDARQKEMAAATLASGIHTADGQLSLYLVKAPWCDGGVYTLNPDPDLPVTAGLPATKAKVMEAAIAGAFKHHPPSTNSATPGTGLDGVYFDSLEMSCLELNYRRDHFPAADFPLVFDGEGRPAQMMFFSTLDFVRSVARDLHRRDLLTFANAVLWNFSLPAPWLDVMGTEVNWMREGSYAPDPDVVMNFRRALCRQKPYCLLLNTDYAKFTSEHVERYFNRCLFYGIWPGFFDQDAASKDPYWLSGKKWYARDRALFQQYIPLLRAVTDAGWEPVTGAVCDNAQLWLERFGNPGQGRCLLTVFNDTAVPQAGVIMPADGVAPGRKWTSAKTLHGAEAARAKGGWAIRVAPQATVVLELGR